MLGYFAFLVAHGCFQDVTIHYLIAGHTHCSPDRVFGWLRGQLKNTDIVDLDDILKKLNDPSVAPSYSGKELQPRDIEKWSELVSSVISAIQGIRKFHLVKIRLEESEVPQVVIEAKNASDQQDFDFRRTIEVNKFPEMTVDSYQPEPLPISVIQALRFSSDHIGDRTFRYLEND